MVTERVFDTLAAWGQADGREILWLQQKQDAREAAFLARVSYMSPLWVGLHITFWSKVFVLQWG